MERAPLLLVASTTGSLDTYMISLLEQEGHQVEQAVGYDAILAASVGIDLVVLNIYSPNDLELVQAIRHSSGCGLIVIGPARAPHLLVSALESGADDYVVRPSRIDELQARVRARIRRLNQTVASQALWVGPLCLDQRTRRATRNGQQIELSPAEFAVLLALANAPNRRQRAELLLQHALGECCRDLCALEEIISHLRSLIEIDPHDPRIIAGDLYRGYTLQRR